MMTNFMLVCWILRSRISQMSNMSNVSTFFYFTFLETATTELFREFSKADSLELILQTFEELKEGKKNKSDCRNH